MAWWWGEKKADTQTAGTWFGNGPSAEEQQAALQQSPELDDQNELRRRFTGPPVKGEYLWRVTYRIKGTGRRGRERPQVIRVLATGQLYAEEAVKAYMLHMYGKDVTIDSAYNAGQAAYYSHWWFRDATGS